MPPFYSDFRAIKTGFTEILSSSVISSNLPGFAVCVCISTRFCCVRVYFNGVLLCACVFQTSINLTISYTVILLTRVGYGYEMF